MYQGTIGSIYAPIVQQIERDLAAKDIGYIQSEKVETEVQFLVGAFRFAAASKS